MPKIYFWYFFEPNSQDYKALIKQECKKNELKTSLKTKVHKNPKNIKMKITHKIQCFGARKSVYHSVLLVPSFESTGHGPETETRSSSYADFS